MARKSKSSGRWMAEHQRDEFVRRAAAEGWRSRAVYKLAEIDEKDRLIKPGMTVVDLGAAPGGWSQYAARKVGRHGRVIAMDLLEMPDLEGVTFVQGDFTESSVLEELMRELDGVPVDLVISDMAPNISGIKAVDQPRAMYLAELALDFAGQVLTEDGSLLVKMFQGAGSEDFLADMRKAFEQVKTRKPRASRPRSREVYVLGTNRRMI
ncbi:MAG: 23S rRNA (uridine(2552)-2'-O)-methyltransferase RlmE [Gammaproteobacteria bacterium]|nr:23S rRNA (uridine(2552)-2'-O)-methyltransferase RlmE [Gammaproteobacteria bacterium]